MMNCNELDFLKYEKFQNQKNPQKMRRNANIRIKCCSVEVYAVIYFNGYLSQDPLQYITLYTSTEHDLIL